MHFVILTILAAAIAFAGFAPAHAQSGMRSSVSVETPEVRLRDIFPGAENNVVIAKTPAPGKRMVLDVYALGRLAKRHGVVWRPRTRFDQSVIKRESRILAPAEIETALQRALISRGMEDDRLVELNNKSNGIRVATGVSVPFHVENPIVDERSGRVTANLSVNSGNGNDLKYRLDGSTYTVLEVPVLNRRIRRGEILLESDVIWKKIRKAAVGRNVIRERKSAVGKAARRYLSAGKPFLIDDLEAPKLVRKGSLVTIYLETANLLLTAKARATEDGALNDTVRVVNVRSKKTVEAIVHSPTKVFIPAAQPVTN